MRSFPNPFCCSPPKGKGAWCASMALSPWATFAGPAKASLHPSKRGGFPFHLLKKAYFFKLRRQRRASRHLGLQKLQPSMMTEGFQRAIGKPFGRARRPETFCACTRMEQQFTV